MLDSYRGNWLVRLMTNGFESVMAVYGTEEEMRQYLRSELEGCSFSYVGMSDERYGDQAVRFLRRPALFPSA